MPNNVKTIEKVRFGSRPRSLRRGAASSDRAPAPLAHALSTTGQAPVAIGRGPIPTTTGIAQQLGWLQREAALDGIPLTVAGDSLVAPLRDPLLLRAAAPQDLIREGESVAALWTQSLHRDTRLIGLTWVDTFQGVLALPGSGIVEPAHLAGRRVGLPFDPTAPIDVRRAAARRGVQTALALAGLFPEDVVEVDIPVSGGESESEIYGAELAALRGGEVDAIYVAGALGMAAATRIGAVEVVDLGAHLDPMVRAGAATPATITVDARLLEERPNVVVRMLAVLLRAGAWAQAHPTDATRLVAAETGATPAEVVAAHGSAWHERLHPDLSEHKLAALRTQRDFLRTHGFLEADVDLGAWIDPRPLGTARELLAAERTTWL